MEAIAAALIRCELPSGGFLLRPLVVVVGEGQEAAARVRAGAKPSDAGTAETLVVH